MTMIKLATSVRMNSTLERDKVQINPVVQTTAGITNADSLAQDWVTALLSHLGWSTQYEVHCKAYDLSKPAPNYPIGEYMVNPNAFSAGALPMEVSLCLSFYAGANVKRRRGRLYIPASWIVGGTSAGVRPTQTMIDKVMGFGPILEQLGGVDVDWSVYSKVDHTCRAVTNYWCDDEWDTQRRRGLRGVTRSEATTAEESIVTRQIGPY